MADPSSNPDPYHVEIPTAELALLASALDLVDRHAELNHRYRKLISDSRRVLAAERIRLTQARGIAKKLLVLVKAADPELRGTLGPAQLETLDAGLSRADELIRSEPG